MSVVINDKPRRQRALNWRWPVLAADYLKPRYAGRHSGGVVDGGGGAAVNQSAVFTPTVAGFGKNCLSLPVRRDLWMPRCGSIWRRV